MHPPYRGGTLLSLRRLSFTPSEFAGSTYGPLFPFSLCPLSDFFLIVFVCSLDLLQEPGAR